MDRGTRAKILFPETIIKETYKSVILEDRERWDRASWDRDPRKFQRILRITRDSG